MSSNCSIGFIAKTDAGSLLYYFMISWLIPLILLLVSPQLFMVALYKVCRLKCKLDLLLLTFGLKVTNGLCLGFCERIRVFFFCKRVELQLELTDMMAHEPTGDSNVQKVKRNVNVLESLIDTFEDYKSYVNSSFSAGPARALTGMLHKLEGGLEKQILAEVANFRRLTSGKMV